MDDFRRGGFTRFGLGVIGDAQARALDHRYVIGAVANRQRQRAVDAAGDRRV